MTGKRMMDKMCTTNYRKFDSDLLMPCLQYKYIYYFGGARSKGFATLRNVSKLPFFDLSSISLFYNVVCIFFHFDPRSLEVYYRCYHCWSVSIFSRFQSVFNEKKQQQQQQMPWV